MKKLIELELTDYEMDQLQDFCCYYRGITPKQLIEGFISDATGSDLAKGSDEEMWISSYLDRAYPPAGKYGYSNFKEYLASRISYPDFMGLCFLANEILEGEDIPEGFKKINDEYPNYPFDEIQELHDDYLEQIGFTERDPRMRTEKYLKDLYSIIDYYKSMKSFIKK